MLKLLSLIYKLIIGVRNWLYDRRILSSYQSTIPIICVGNVTVGGNGKTPLVIRIAQDLQSQGYSPVILSRGYGGKVIGPYLLKSTDSAMFVGDEPTLIAEETKCPVVIARNRTQGCKLIEADKIGNIVIMDDGFQHRRLSRTLNILCFDISSQEAVSLATNKLLLPAGRLRESLASALERSQMVICNSRKNEFTEPLNLSQLVSQFGTLPVYFTKLSNGRIYNLDLANKLILEKGPIILLSAIAKPEGFKQSVQNLGHQIVETFFYPDHFNFTEIDIQKIRDRFPDSPILCTTKDAVKIKSLSNVDNIWVYKTDLEFKNLAPRWESFL